MGIFILSLLEIPAYFCLVIVTTSTILFRDYGGLFSKQSISLLHPPTWHICDIYRIIRAANTYCCAPVNFASYHSRLFRFDRSCFFFILSFVVVVVFMAWKVTIMIAGVKFYGFYVWIKWLSGSDGMKWAWKLYDFYSKSLGLMCVLFIQEFLRYFDFWVSKC